jgi:hypothetical protein
VKIYGLVGFERVCRHRSSIPEIIPLEILGEVFGVGSQEKAKRLSTRVAETATRLSRNGFEGRRMRLPLRKIQVRVEVCLALKLS